MAGSTETSCCFEWLSSVVTDRMQRRHGVGVGGSEVAVWVI